MTFKKRQITNSLWIKAILVVLIIIGSGWIVHNDSTSKIIKYQQSWDDFSATVYLEETEIPFIYTAGNHDWQYDIPGENLSLRKE